MSRQRALAHNTRQLSVVDIDPGWSFDIYCLSFKLARKTKAAKVFEEFLMKQIKENDCADTVYSD